MNDTSYIAETYLENESLVYFFAVAEGKSPTRVRYEFMNKVAKTEEERRKEEKSINSS